MFHEYRDEISQLKQNDAHFAKIFEKHNELDSQIEKAEKNEIILTDLELETLKKEKLLVKDEVYAKIVKFKETNK
jgi:uncharacterized protein YdcH (DUF465 family)